MPMDKVIYTRKDVEFLLDWRDKNKDLVRMNACPLKAVKIEVSDNGIAMTFVRSGTTIDVRITQFGKSIGRLVFEILEVGLYKVVKNTARTLNNEDIQGVVTVYASTMAILSYGSATAKPSRKTTTKSQTRRQKPVKSRQRSKSKGATYILKRQGKEAHIVKQGSHRKPEGSFTVRGHFRHYQNGKIIWIEEFMKGSGKKKDKIYKL